MKTIIFALLPLLGFSQVPGSDKLNKVYPDLELTWVVRELVVTSVKDRIYWVDPKTKEKGIWATRECFELTDVLATVEWKDGYVIKIEK